MDQFEDFNKAITRVNEGEAIPPVDASCIERWWNVVSSIPKEQREHVAFGAGAFGISDPEAEPLTGEQKLAVTVRFAILSALNERGVLDEYMKEESSRKKVFRAIASIQCDKNDFGEAVAERAIRNLPVEQQKEANEQFRKVGYDPEHLRIVEKIEVLMRELD